jgi:ABC-2 type transport system permease protein
MLALWVTPLAWLLLFAFLLLQGISFYIVVDHHAHFASMSIDQGPVQSYFSSLFIPFSLLFVCPALTMGAFAEERRSGTIETLLTAPVSAPSVVFAK